MSSQYSAIFLDRDGVINVRIKNGYVLSPQQFEFIEGSDSAVALLSGRCQKIFIVTNQQCVGKGLLTLERLDEIHAAMVRQIESRGGHIDRIYVSPYLSAENHPDRKPNIGLALQAQKEFPEIDLSRSLMIGDSASDMEFAHRAGMNALFIESDGPCPIEGIPAYPTLLDAAKSLW